MEGEMKDIILSMPQCILYLVIVVVLFVTALWTRPTGRRSGASRGTAPMARRGAGDTPVAALWNPDREPSRSSALPRQLGRPPFPDLQATLSARYAARLEQAIRTIRVGRLTGARPSHPGV
jgi:hypothetical protein